MVDLHLTKQSAPSQVPPSVYAEVLAWMEERGIRELLLDANAQGYGVLIDPEEDSIPVGLVPQSELEDAKALLEHLEMAWRCYLDGANCTS